MKHIFLLVYMSETIVFSESAKHEVLSLFDKTVDTEGYIVESDDNNQRVLTKSGEEILFEEWAGVTKGSEVFVKSDAISLLEVAKKLA